MPIAVVDLSASGNPLSAAGDGRHHVVKSILLTWNDSAGTDTVILKSGSTALSGAIKKSFFHTFAEPLHLGVNETFTLTLSGSFDVDGFVEYHTTQA